MLGIVYVYLQTRANSADGSPKYIVWNAVVMKGSYSDKIEVRVSGDGMDVSVNGIKQKRNKTKTYLHKGFNLNYTFHRLYVIYHCYLNNSVGKVCCERNKTSLYPSDHGPLDLE